MSRSDRLAAGDYAVARSKNLVQSYQLPTAFQTKAPKNHTLVRLENQYIVMYSSMIFQHTRTVSDENPMGESASHLNRASASRESPFELAAESAYQTWRTQKLADYPMSTEPLLVQIQDPSALTADEHAAIQAICRKTNLVIYRTQPPRFDKNALRQLGLQLGLRHLDNNLCADEDAITSLRVAKTTSHPGYIPYTNRPLNWHTDGYYNRLDRQIQAWSLHCAQDAASGGENALLDPEIAYLLLRDENPDYIAALRHPQAMTIPANESGGNTIRAEQTGPVFSIDPDTGDLHMRYTARKRNVIWRNEALTLSAVRFLETLWHEGTPFIYRFRLRPGEGILSNNALHNRAGFTDSQEPTQQRLVYRARYYDRIAGTGLHENPASTNGGTD